MAGECIFTGSLCYVAYLKKSYLFSIILKCCSAGKNLISTKVTWCLTFNFKLLTCAEVSLLPAHWQHQELDSHQKVATVQRYMTNSEDDLTFLLDDWYHPVDHLTADKPLKHMQWQSSKSSKLEEQSRGNRYLVFLRIMGLYSSYWTQVRLLATRKPVIREANVSRKESQSFGEMVDSYPETTSEDSARPWQFLNGKREVGRRISVNHWGRRLGSASILCCMPTCWLSF